jgi:putative tricarboxylic transport membrane protein
MPERFRLPRTPAERASAPAGGLFGEALMYSGLRPEPRRRKSLPPDPFVYNLLKYLLGVQAAGNIHDRIYQGGRMTVKKPADLATAVVLLIGVGFVYKESLKIDTSLNYALGPLFFPYLLMAAIALLSAALALQSVSFRGTGGTARSGPGISGSLIMQAALIVSLVVYLVVLPVLGYIPATILFLSGSMILLSNRKPGTVAVAVGAAVVVTVSLWFLFGKILLLFLP